jgi:uncharacterized protein (TIGR02270 family)
MSVPITSPEIVPVVVIQHAEEAAFLWHLRSLACHAPHYNLHELGVLDERVEAHLDGLRVAGKFGWDMCLQALDDEDGGSYFAAGVLAFGSQEPVWFEDLVGLPARSESQTQGLQAALGWVPATQARSAIDRMLDRDKPTLTRIAIAAAAQNAYDPGPALLSALDCSNVPLRSCALRAVGELGRVDLLELVQEQLNHEAPEIRFSASWSAALLGDDKSAISYLVSVSESIGSTFRPPALGLVLRKMDIEASYRLVLDLEPKTGNRRMGIIGAGILGDPRLIPWIIQGAQQPELARAAGEAFTMITGLDLAEERLAGEKPKAFAPGPTEDPDDQNVDLDPDENLPWPDAVALEGWWNRHSGELGPGIRYLLGKPITVEWLQQVLRIGHQRQRAAAALELKILHPDLPLFDVQAPTFRQQLLLEIQR